MSDDLDLYGVTLTLAECDEVLRWVREPWTVRPACMIWGCADRPAIPRSNGDYYVELTSDVIKRIRDHATPWTEVRRDEVKPGEVFRYEFGGCDWIAGKVMPGAGALDWMMGHEIAEGSNSSGGSHPLAWQPRRTVLVRRPRKRTLLPDVEPGQRFVFTHLPDQPRRRTRQGFVNEGTWDHEIIPAGSEVMTVPITLIKEEE